MTHRPTAGLLAVGPWPWRSESAPEVSEPNPKPGARRSFRSVTPSNMPLSSPLSSPKPNGGPSTPLLSAVSMPPCTVEVAAATGMAATPGRLPGLLSALLLQLALRTVTVALERLPASSGTGCACGACMSLSARARRSTTMDARLSDEPARCASCTRRRAAISGRRAASPRDEARVSVCMSGPANSAGSTAFLPINYRIYSIKPQEAYRTSIPAIMMHQTLRPPLPD